MCNFGETVKCNNKVHVGLNDALFPNFCHREAAANTALLLKTPGSNHSQGLFEDALSE